VETKITGITYYYGDKGDEIADYSHATKLGERSQVKSTSIFFYTGKRASALTGEEIITAAMTKSESFLGAVTDVDETKITGITYYYGDKGDEIADYSHATKLGQRAQVKSTSIFFYAGKRASALTATEILTAAMTKSESFLGAVTDVVEAKITGVTYYYGDKGDEIANYSHATKLGERTEVKSTSIFFYMGKRANALTGEEIITAAMTKSESFLGAVTDVDETKITGITCYYGDKGDEIANYSHATKLGERSQVKSTSIFFYANKRASALTAEEIITAAMTKSESFLGAVTDVVEAKITGVTYYYGDKGDEIANYSHATKLGERSQVKSTSIFFYAGKRASVLTAEEIITAAMTKSESFLGAVTDVDETKITGITYYYGEKGDEVADYSHATKLGERSQVKSTSLFFYAGKRASSLTATEILTAAMTKSESFLGAVTDVDETKITGITYYYGDKGDEIADYSHSTKLGQRSQVKSTSIFFYAGKRAKALTGEEIITAAMTKSESFLGAVTDVDEAKITGITYYYGDKGEEVADYSHSTKLGQRSQVKSTSIFFYAGKRANALTAVEIITAAMTKSESFLGAVTDVVEAKITGITYYYGDKGDEIADYSHSTKLGQRSQVKSTSIFFYAGKRASALTAVEIITAAMTKSESFLGAVTDVVEAKITGVTYYYGDKGDEIADYSHSTKLGQRSQVKSTSIFFYNNKRASALTAVEIITAAMTKSESFLGAVTDVVEAKITGITYYYGDKGDEIANYSHSTKLGQRSQVKSTSIFFYAGKRASALTAVEIITAAMTKSESFLGAVTDVAETKITGITYYYGDKGDEIADYSHSTKLGQRSQVKSTSIFFYNNKRASALTAVEIITAAMTKSELFQGAVTDVDEDKITGITYYYGDKGDEIADYSHSTKLGDRAQVKSTSVFFYAGKRASALTAEEIITAAMTRSESFLGAVTGVVEGRITGITYYVGDKGDEVADYSHSTKLGQRNQIKSTSIFFYANKRASALAGTEIITAAMTKSESFLGAVTDVDETKITGITYYYGEKGDEIANYSHSTKLGERAEVKSTSIFFYANKRASALSGTEVLTAAMTKSESFMGAVTDIVAAKITGITYYYGDKGDEIANYSHSTKLGQRAQVKSTSIFFYADKRASALTAEEMITAAMTKSESFMGAVTDVDETKITGITYYYGDKGDEIANYSHSTKVGDRSQVKSTSIFFYGDKRASALTAEEIITAAMNKSESFQGAVISVDETKITGITYYVGDKGDEVADYSHTTRLGNRGMVKSTSIFFYGDKRASDLTATEIITAAMNRSESFQGAVTDVDETKIAGVTYYYGDKGDEIADYSHSMLFGQRSVVKASTVFFYGANKRASALTGTELLTAAMAKTESFKGAVTGVVEAKITGITYYAGEKGDELVDYSYSVKLGARSDIKSTTLYQYGESYVSASAAGATDRLSKQEIWGMDKLSDANSRLLQEIYLVGEKGNELADYARIYTKDGHIKTTEIFLYGTGGRAVEALDDFTAMSYKDTYYLDVEVTPLAVGPAASIGLTIKASRTYFDTHLARGDEIVDKVETYDKTGKLVSTTTHEYEGGASASSAGWDSALRKQTVTANDTEISIITYDGIKGEEKIQTITDRKGVVQYYNYSGDDLDTVTMDNGSLVKYTKNIFDEDEVVYSQDYRGIKTYNMYNEDRILISSYQETTVAKFDGTNITPVTNRVDMFYENDPFYDPRLVCTVSDAEQEKNVVTVYQYSVLTYELFYTTEYSEVPQGSIDGIMADGVVTREEADAFSAGDEITKTYYKKNEYNEQITSFVIQPNGVFVYYNYEEVEDPTYAEDNLKFRTVITRTKSLGSYTSFDSITVLDKYGELAFTVNSDGVTQYQHFYPSSVHGVPINEQTDVLSSVYHYDLNGRLLYVEQDEYTTYQMNDHTMYLPLRIKYEYDYEIDSSTGELISAKAIGSSGSSLFRTQYFDDEMKLSEVWEWADYYNDEGDYIGKVWARTQEYMYFPPADASSSSIATNLLEALQLTGTGIVSIDELPTGDYQVTINGVDYTINPASIQIVDQLGNPLSWGQFNALCAAGQLVISDYMDAGGALVYVTVALAPTSTQEGDEIDDITDTGTGTETITINGTSYTVDTATVTITGSDGNSLTWEEFAEIYNNEPITYASVETSDGAVISITLEPISSTEESQVVNDITDTGTGTETITVNGTSYTVDTDTVTITDSSGNSMTWEEFTSLYGNEPVTYITVETDNGSVTEITVMTSRVLIGTATLGSSNVEIWNDTVIVDTDGNTMTPSEFLEAYNANPSEFYTTVEAVKLSDGTWRATKITIIKAPPKQVRGNLDSLYNPSGISVMTGILSATTFDVITFQGENIKVTADTAVIDADGNEISGSASQKTAALEEIRQRLAADGGLMTIRLVAMKNAGEWQAQQIIVEYDIPDVPASTLTGEITALDDTAWTITLGGEEMSIEDAIITDVSGRVISLAALAQFWANNDANEVGTYVRVTGKRMDGVWNISKVNIISDSAGSGEMTGMLNGVTVTGADTGTITLDGKTIIVNGASVLKNSGGSTITLDRLNSLLSYNQLRGVTTNIQTVFNVTAAGLVLQELTVLTRLDTVLNTTTLIDDITFTGAGEGTITMSDGTVFTVGADTVIRDVNYRIIALEELPLEAVINIRLIKTEDGWKAERIYISEELSATNSLDGQITDVDTTAGTLTIGGVTGKVMADVTKIVDKYGTLLPGGIAGLKALCDSGAQVVMTLDMRREGGEWVIVSAQITNVVNVVTHLSASDFTVVARDGDGNPSKISVNGMVIDIGNSTATDGFFTDVVIEYVNDYNPSEALEVAFRSEDLNPDYDISSVTDADSDGIDDTVEVSIWGGTAVNGGNFAYDSDADGMADLMEWYFLGHLRANKEFTTSYSYVLYEECGYSWTGINSVDDVDGDGMQDILEVALYGHTGNNVTSMNYDSNSNGVTDIIEDMLFGAFSKDSNHAYERIGGIEGFVGGAHAPIVETEYPRDIDIQLVAYGDGWRAEKIIAKHVTSAYPDHRVDGPIQEIDIHSHTIMLNDIPVIISSEDTVSDYYGNNYTVRELQEIFAGNGNKGTYVSGTTVPGYAVEVNEVGDGQTSTIKKTVAFEVSSILSFKWKVSSELNDYFRFFVDGVEVTGVPGISGETDWATVNVALAAGSHTLEWKYVKDGSISGGEDTAWIDEVEIKPSAVEIDFDPIQGHIALPEGYTTSGNAEFFVQSSISHDEYGYSAEAGAIQGGQQSVLEKKVTLDEVSDMSFWWRISSGDKAVSLYVDGQLITSLSGNTDADGAFREYVVESLAAGVEHTIRWVYTRTEVGQDVEGETAWVDDITFFRTARFFDQTEYAIDPVLFQTDNWVNQSVTSFEEGTFSMQSGAVNAGGSSYLTKTVQYAEDTELGFYWKIDSASTDKLKFYLDGVLVDLMSGDSSATAGSENGWVYKRVTLQGGVQHTLRWEYDRSGTVSGDANGNAWLGDVTIVTTRAYSFDLPLDTEADLPEAYGTDNWVSQNAISFDANGFAAQSGSTAAGAKSYFDRSVELADGATLTFKWRVDSASTDKLKFYIDGSDAAHLKGTISGSADGWVTYSVYVPAGSHTLRWEYDRTGTSGAADSRAWVDEIEMVYHDTTQNFTGDAYPYGTEISVDNMGFTSDGWKAQNTTSYDIRGFAAETPDIAAGNSTYMQRDIDLSEDGLVQFMWMLNTDPANEMIFQVIDRSDSSIVEETRISGLEDWARYSTSLLEAGAYTVKWTYVKTSDNPLYIDKGWVDDVVIKKVAGSQVMTVDGTNEYLSITPVSFSGNITLSARVQFPLPGTSGGYRTLFQRTGGTYHHVLINSAGELGVSNNNWYSSGFNVNQLSEGVHQITAVLDRDANVTKFYVDGEYVATAASIVTYDIGTIGNHSGGGQNIGEIDDVAMFDRALTEAEIRSLNNSGVTGLESDLVFYYDFNDGTATDVSGNGHDGTLLNGASIAYPMDIFSEQAFYPDMPFYHEVELSSEYTTNTDARAWNVNNLTSYDAGGYSAQSGTTSGGQVSYMSKTVTSSGGTTLRFKWRIDALGTDLLKVLVNGVLVNSISGSSGWREYTIDLASGTNTITWQYDRSATSGGAAANGNAWVDEIIVENDNLTSDFSAQPSGADRFGMPVGYSGDTWLATNKVAYDDLGYSIQTKDIAAGNSTYTQRTGLTLDGRGRVEFVWKLQTGIGNSMKFEVIDESDSSVVYTAQISGISDWQKVRSDALAAGTYTIRWTYVKNANDPAIEDHGWIDDIHVYEKSDNAMFCDGSNDYIYVNDNPDVSITGNQTISMWVNPSDLDNRMNPFYKSYGAEGAITIETDGTINYYYGACGSDGTPYQTFNSGVRIKAGEWNHIAIVRDLDNMKLRWYINGELVSETDALFSNAADSTSRLNIGDSYSGCSDYKGWMDDFAMYSRALMASEIADMVQNGVDAGSSGLVLYYNFDDGTATNLSPVTVTTNRSGETLFVSKTIDVFRDSCDYVTSSTTYASLPDGYVTTSGQSAWRCQSGDIPEGTLGYAAQAGDTASGAKSYMERTVDMATDGSLSFLWKLDSSAGDKLKLYVDGVLKATVTGTSGGWVTCDADIAAGSHTIKWEYDRSSSSGVARNGAWVDEVVVSYGDVLVSARPDAYPTGTELSTLPEGFTTTGWVLQNSVSQKKPGFAAASNVIAAGGSTSMQKDITLSGIGKVAFDWKVSSREGNELVFQVINKSSGQVVEETRISGDEDWVRFTSQELTAGIYTVKWTYVKTVENSVYEDKGWVDNLEVMTITHDGALECLSSAEFVKVTSPVNMSGDRTISAWVNFPLPDTGTWRTLFQYFGGTYHHIIVSDSGDIGLYNNAWYFSGYNINGLSEGMHHIATTSTSSGTRFYVDGVFVGEVGTRVTQTLGAVGNHSSGGQNAGIMDDVAVFNRSLSDAEILTLTQNGVGALSGTDLELHYSFNDGTATDLSGKGHDGILCYGADAGKLFGHVSFEEFEPTGVYADEQALPEGYTTNTDARGWKAQNAVSVDAGGYAAASGLTSAGAKSFMSRTVSVTGDASLEFKWKVDSASTDRLRVYVDGVEKNVIIGNTAEWFSCSVALTAGSHTITWEYDRSATSSGSSANAWVDEVAVKHGEVEQDFSYSTFDPGMSYALSGYSTDGWIAQNIVYAGAEGYAAQTKAISVGQSTYLQKTGIVLTDKGTVSFDWKLAAEDGNIMKFEIIRQSDSTVVYSRSINGEKDWEKITTGIIPAGTYTIKWTYTKNEAAVARADKGWVDNFKVFQNADMCMDFDGSNDYVRRNNATALQITGNQTISLWVRPDSFESRQSLINKAYGGEGSITLEQDGTLEYRYGTCGGDNSPYQAVNSKVKLDLGEWAYVAVVRDLTNMKIRWYINGELVNEEDAQYASATASTAAFDIGRGYASNFNGGIDEVALYKTAKTEADIDTIMGSGPNVSDTNLVLYYSFNDGTATDQTSNALNGSISDYPAKTYRQKNVYGDDFDSEVSPVLTGSLPEAYGTSAWTVQNQVVPDGTTGFAAQAPSTTAGATSSMSRIVTLDGTATLSFQWMVGSVPTDKLRLYIDGSPVGYINGGASSWATWSSTLGAGTHTIRWEYDRSGSSGAADNRAWVDEVRVAYDQTTQNFSSALPTNNVPASGMWVAGEGYIYQDENDSSDSSPARYILDDVSVTNGTIKTKVNLGNSTNNNPIIFFRMQDDNNGYALKVRNNYMYLYKITNGNLGSHIDYKSGTGNLSENTWYDVEITLTGSTIEYWIDSDQDGVKDTAEYKSKTDTSYSTGKVGYGTGSLSSRTYFDDVIQVSGVGYSVTDRLNALSRNGIVPVSGTWAITGGAIQQSSTSNYNKALINDAQLKDGSISAKIKIDYSSSDYGYIYFRMDDALQSGYAVRVDGNENIVLERFSSDGSSTSLISKGMGSYISGINMQAYHDIRVALDGAMMTVFVDGVEIMSWSDATYYDDAHTSAALGTHSVQSGYNVWFDDVTISGAGLVNDNMNSNYIHPNAPEVGAYRVIDGVATVVSDGESRFMLGGNMFQYGTLNTRIKFQNGGSSGENATIYFGMDDENNGYAVTIRSDGYMYLYKSINGWPTGTQITYQSMGSITGGAWVNVQIQRDSSGLITIRVDTNGDSSYSSGETASVTDKTFMAAGRVGVGTRDHAGTISFDSIVNQGAGYEWDPVDILSSMPRMTMMSGRGTWGYLDYDGGNRAYVQMASDDNSTEYNSYVNGAKLVDGTLGIDIRLDGSGGNMDESSVYFRMSDDQKNGYVMKWRQDRRLYLYKVTNGSLTELGNTTLSWMDPTQFHKFRIDLDGGMVRISVDNSSDVLTVANMLYYGDEFCNISIGTRYASGPVWFDNIKVINATRGIGNFIPVTDMGDVPIKGGAWKVQDNYITQAFTQNDSSVQRLMVPGATIQQGTVSTKIRFDSYDGSDNYACLFFGMDGNDNGYAAVIYYRGSSTDYVYLYEVNGGSLGSQIGSSSLGATGIIENTTYTLSVTHKNSNADPTKNPVVQVFLNGEEKINRQNTAYRGAAAGIGTAYTGIPVSFADFTVADQAGNPITVPSLTDIVEEALTGTFAPAYGGIWKYADDGKGGLAYAQIASDDTNTYYKSKLYAPAIVDGEIKASIKMDRVAGSEEQVQLYFRMSDDGRYGYAAELRSNGYIYLYRVDNNNLSTQMASYNLSANIPGYSVYDYHDITVKFNGAVMSVSVDGLSDIMTVSDMGYYGENYSNVFVGTRYASGAVWFKDVMAINSVCAKDSMSEGFTSLYTPDAGAWRAENGYVAQSYSGASRYILNDSSVMNGTITTKVKFEANSSNSDYATFYFRMDENDNGYLASVRNGYLEIFKVVDGWVSGSSLATRSLDALYSNVWYDVQIELNGSQLIARVDSDRDGTYQSDETATATDSEHSGPGKIGIGTRGQSDDIWFTTLTASENGMAYHPDTPQLAMVPRLAMMTGDGRWTAMDDGTGNVAYAQIACNDANSYYMSYLNGADISDGKLGVRIKIDGNIGSTDEAYMYFRMSVDYKNGYALVWRGDRNLYLYRINNGSAENLGSVSLSGVDPKEYHDFIIDLDGEDIAISVDDKVNVLTRKDLRYYGEGYMDAAVGTRYASSPIWFDDITVAASAASADSFTRADVPANMPVGGKWVVDGAYLTEVEDGQSRYIMEGSSARNGNVDTTIRFSGQETGNNQALIYFRMDAGNNGYAAMIKGDGYVYIYRVADGVLKDAIVSGDLGQIYTGYAYNVRVNMLDGRLRIYVDMDRDGAFEDSEYKEANDNSFKEAGMVGIGTNDANYPISFGSITTSEDGKVYQPYALYSQVPRGSLLWTYGGQWQYMDDGTGEMVYAQTWGDDSNTQYKAMFNGAELVDGTVQADIKLSGNNGNTDEAYLYFRMSDDLQLGYAVCLRGDSRLYLYKVTGSTYTNLGYVTLTDHISGFSPTGEYHKIKVTLDGGDISVSVDGVDNILNKRDLSYSYDNVGLGTRYADSPACFDNLDIVGAKYTTDGFNMSEETFSTPSNGRWVVDGTSGMVSQTYNMTSTFLMEGSSVANGTINTTIKFASTSTSDNAIIYFRMDDNGNGYAADFRPDGYMYLYRVEKGEIVTSYYLDRKDFGVFNANVQYKVSIVLNGEQITIKGDGNNNSTFDSPAEELTVIDFTHTGAGKIGIGTRGNTAPISFGTIQVPELSATYDPVAILNSVPNSYPVGVYGDWGFEDSGNGDMCYTQKTVTDSACFAILNGTNAVTGNTLQTDFRLDGTGDDYAYLYFGMNDSNNGYAVRARRNGTTLNLRIYSIVNGAESSYLSSEVGYNNFDFSKFQTLKVELINEGGNTRVKTYIDGYKDTNYIQSTSTISGLVSGRIGLATRNMKERVWFNNTGIADEEL
ncbi:MAG: hypothetical protein PHY34_05735, partial [Patescibacteria group bacterium]|nr:hypothetical protein [Patescibacteria group bacterium]